MQVAVQLTLDEALATCPRCGHEFAVQQAVVDTKVAMLPPATRQVWDAAGWRFWRGIEAIGPSRLAAKVNRDESTVRYHLAVLMRAGLVRAVPKNKYRRHYHIYTGTAS